MGGDGRGWEGIEWKEMGVEGSGGGGTGWGGVGREGEGLLNFHLIFQATWAVIQAGLYQYIKL